MILLWEEIKKRKKKKMQNERSVKIDTINEIKTQSKSEISDTIIPKYRKNCPKCYRQMTYSDKYKLFQSIKKETVCIHCCQLKNKNISTIATTRNCPNCNKLLTYKSNNYYRKACNFNKKCKSCTHIGHKHTDKSREKMSIIKSGINNPNFGKIGPNAGKQKIKGDYVINGSRYWKRDCPQCKCEILYKSKRNRDLSTKFCKKCTNLSPEKRLKHRLSILKFIHENHGGIRTMVNPTACKFIEEYGKTHDYKFQHALNGGEFYIKELGYFVDGYDREKNVVFEYDEAHHFSNGKLKQKDIQRMIEIKNYLKCKFIRYNEKINETVEY